MDKKQFEAYSYPKEMFEVVTERDLHDKKLETKPIGYFKDAFRRFCKNKSSVVAAVIIMLLVGFALIGPFFSSYSVEFNDIKLPQLLPKNESLKWLGWDGGKRENGISAADYLKYKAMELETGEEVIMKDFGSYQQNDNMNVLKTYYNAKINSYAKNCVKEVQLTLDEYKALQEYQDEHEIQIIFPYVSPSKLPAAYQNDPSCYYEIQTKGVYKNFPAGYTNESDVDNFEFKIIYDTYEERFNENDYYTSKMRIEEGRIYEYCDTGPLDSNGVPSFFLCRVDYNRYFAATHDGKEPCFLFGSDQYGKDIYVRLCSGARFSFLFAICISVINLTIGAIYGAIEGYYGGAADMIMERVSDILSGVPFMVVVTLFKLHIMNKVGMIPTLLFAFVLTGWIGMASNTRMQFYRFKNQEYVLAARTLGAKDLRIMFKHIFPNALGTLITSCVMVIPGVIFSESSLSYLGIVNLSMGSVTSVGTLLANGQGTLQSYPHIIMFPAGFIALLEISFNLFGNGLRDAFNPSLRGAED